MENSENKNTLYFGLSSEDTIFTILTLFLFIICFYVIFALDYSRISESIKDKDKFIFSVFQIGTLLALTSASLYVHYSKENSSFFYLSLFWLAHAIYKVFTIGRIVPEFNKGQIQPYVISKDITISGEDVGKQYLLIAIIALAADLPLLLSSFPQKQRKLWLFLIPISTFVLMVIVYNSGFDIIPQIRILYFISPIHSLLIFLWLSYSITFKNVLEISKILRQYFGVIFIAFAISQLPFLYESFCTPNCPENQIFVFIQRLFALSIFIFALLITLLIAKEELSGIRKKQVLAEKQLEVKGEFEELGYLTASIEHELRTPLAVFDNTIHLLNKKYQKDEELLKKLNLLERHRLRILAAADIINTLRSNRNDIINELHPVKIRKIVNLSIEDVKKEFGNNVDEIYFQINEKNKELEVEVVSPLIEQAIVNILKNSIESILSKGKKGEIKIEIYLVDKRTIALNFWDNGEGFILKDIEKIVKPDYTTKERAKGKPNRGLGLFVCNKIANIHDGKLIFRNNSEGGAIVLFTLPRFVSKKNKLQEENEDNELFET